MKVGMVCPYDWSFPGGVRSHIVGLSGALRRRGVEVEIIAPASQDEPDIFAAGRTVGIPYNGSVARLCFSPRASRAVRGRLRRGDLDLLHIHEPFSPSVSLLALRHASVPVVATFHASAERSLAYQAAKPLLAPLFRRIAVCIAVSSAAERLVGCYFPGEFVRIPNGIERARFAGASPAEIDRGRPIVLFVGRPERRKGLDVAVAAVARVREEVDVDLVAVGPTAADVPGWVRAVGRVDEGLEGVFKAASVFCAPSLEGESFGIVLVEAAAAGTPVVCSDLPGYREAAAGAARHVPVGDVEATARALLTVLRDPAAAAELVAKGERRSAELDWDVLVEGITECYRTAVS